MENKKRKEDSTMASSAFGLIEKGLSRVIDLLFAKSNFAVYPQGEITKMWKEIEDLDPKMAVIEADKLVDAVLKRANVSGNSMADRLRRVQKLVSRKVYNDMWEAHKVRNRLVHEMAHQLNSADSANAIWKMKKFLVDIGAFKNE